MRILITGANGLLGQKLVQRLGQKPQTEVLATGTGPCRILQLPANVSYASCDITSSQDVAQTLASFRPEVVIHSAAMTNVDTCELQPENCRKINVEATAGLLQHCEQWGCHFIFLSTDFIFDGKNGPYSEDAEPAPLSIYGQSKLDAENLVRQSTCKWAIVRTVLVYGIAPGLSRSNIILWVKDSLEKGKAIQVVTDQFRTPTLAEDLAEGCLLIAEKGATGIFHISGEELLTPFEMAMKTADFFKLDKSLISPATAATFSQPAKRPPKTGFILKKAKQELGYKPHSFEEGIAILASQIEY